MAISDLILRQGDARAKALAAKGQMWADLVGQGTFSFANALQARNDAKKVSMQRAAVMRAFSGERPPSIADLVGAGIAPEHAVKMLSDYAAMQPKPQALTPVETVDDHGEPVTQFVDPTKGGTFKKPTPRPRDKTYQAVTLRSEDGSPLAANYDSTTGKYYAPSGEEILNPVQWREPEKPTKKSYEWVMRNGRPMQIEEGTSQAGDVPYRPPTEPKEPKTPKNVWVTRDGKLIPIPEGSEQPGDVPYDAVAARQQIGLGDSRSEAIDTAKEVVRIATALRDHKGFGGTFGIVSSKLPTLSQNTADAEVLLNSLRSLLTLENTGKLKGVLSNADMELLRQASTTLAPQMGEASARSELNRLIDVVGKVVKAAQAKAPGNAPADPLGIR